MTPAHERAFEHRSADLSAKHLAAMRLNPLFAWADPEQLAPLLPRVTIAHYSVDENVWSEREDAGDLTLVLSGRVGIRRPRREGRATFLTFAGPGDLLGELSLFDSHGRQATAVALTPTTGMTIPHGALTQWMEVEPQTYRIFCELLTARIRRMLDTLEDSYGLDVATRLARALVRLGARFGRPSPEGLRFDLALSQEDLAGHVRASRERVNHTLAEFHRRGLISRDTQGILVLDGPGLLARARLRDDVVVRLGSAAGFFTRRS